MSRLSQSIQDSPKTSITQNIYEVNFYVAHMKIPCLGKDILSRKKYMKRDVKILAIQT